MAVILKTNRPAWIIEQLHKRIDEHVIDTWTYDEDGDFTHTGQWQNKAWMCVHIENQRLYFYIIGRKSVDMTLMDYAVFHGRFVELILNQFPEEIKTMMVTAPFESMYDTKGVIL